MRILVDTNVLLRLSAADDPAKGDCVTAIRLLRNRAHNLCICAQVIIEFWGAATRPVENNGLGLSPEEAAPRIEALRESFAVLPEPPDIASIWEGLAVGHGVCGRQVHDARIVALMVAHEVPQLLTLNPSDFLRYHEIAPVTPSAVANSTG